MLLNNLVLDRLTSLIKAIDESNKLKEYELKAKSREVLAREKRNELKEKELKKQ